VLLKQGKQVLVSIKASVAGVCSTCSSCMQLLHCGVQGLCDCLTAPAETLNHISAGTLTLAGNSKSTAATVPASALTCSTHVCTRSASVHASATVCALSTLGDS
jgi:hypothetical protein